LGRTDERAQLAKEMFRAQFADPEDGFEHERDMEMVREWLKEDTNEAAFELSSKNESLLLQGLPISSNPEDMFEQAAIMGDVEILLESTRVRGQPHWKLEVLLNGSTLTRNDCSKTNVVIGIGWTLLRTLTRWGLWLSMEEIGFCLRAIHHFMRESLVEVVVSFLEVVASFPSWGTLVPQTSWN
jgi:hypothetical protein